MYRIISQLQVIKVQTGAHLGLIDLFVFVTFMGCINTEKDGDGED